ncbi:MAG: NAD(P)H-dependent glycerol-3-phosphate dehydrogenase [Planctomycetota bacterium]|jgi:glycerol-3-phosphate dehydrogenase (NAD(P)+)
MAEITSQIGVVGDGAWSTAVAMHLGREGHKVRLWGVFPEYLEEISKTRNNRKFLPGVEIPYEVEFTDSIEELTDGVEFLVEGVPTRYLREVMKRVVPHVDPSVPVVSLTKGIEEETHLRPSQIIRAELGPSAQVVSLSGPSHAEEVAVEQPTSVVAASTHDDLAKRVQEVFSGSTVRVYTSSDLVGVEIGGALKNVVALGAGISDGLGFGDNAKAALLTRGMKEMSDLGAAMGGSRKTFFGLSGIGDLIVTCTSRHGRNHMVGERIGRGETLQEILDSTEKVAEGVYTVKGARLLAKKHGVEMPISSAVYSILYEGKNARKAVGELMTRALKAE